MEFKTHTKSENHIKRIKRNVDRDLPTHLIATWDDGGVIAFSPVGLTQVRAVMWWPGLREALVSEPHEFEDVFTQQGPDCGVKFTFSGDDAEKLETLVKLAPDKG